MSGVKLMLFALHMVAFFPMFKDVIKYDGE
jgi:hypothetical protein